MISDKLSVDNLQDFKEEARLKILRDIVAENGLAELLCTCANPEMGDYWYFGFSGENLHYNWLIRYYTKNTFVEIITNLRIVKNKICYDKLLELSDIPHIETILKKVVKIRKELQEQINLNQIMEDFQ